MHMHTTAVGGEIVRSCTHTYPWRELPAAIALLSAVHLLNSNCPLSRYCRMFRSSPQRALQPSGHPRRTMLSSKQRGCSAVAAPASKALQRPRLDVTHRVPRLTAPPAPPSKVETTEQAR
jgi:hypothetical protein